jgi:hypothetical protein
LYYSRLDNFTISLTFQANAGILSTNKLKPPSVLLFFWTSDTVQYSKTTPLLFGSWIFSPLQAKRPLPLSPAKGSDSIPGLLLSDPAECSFLPEDGGRAKFLNVLVSFQNTWQWIKSRKTAILNVIHHR